MTSEYLSQQDWLIHSALQTAVSRVVYRLEQGEQPAILQTLDRCTVASTDKLVLLEAGCIQKTLSSPRLPTASEAAGTIEQNF